MIRNTEFVHYLIKIYNLNKAQNVMKSMVFSNIDSLIILSLNMNVAEALDILI